MQEKDAKFKKSSVVSEELKLLKKLKVSVSNFFVSAHESTADELKSEKEASEQKLIKDEVNEIQETQTLVHKVDVRIIVMT